MITRHVLNRKIVRVVQSHVTTGAGPHVTVDYLELDNGVKLIPTAYETETEPVGDLIVNEVKRKGRK